MSVSTITNGCKDATSVRTLTLTTDHLMQIELGLEEQIRDLERLIERDPDDMAWRDQLDVARQALRIVQEA
jgi:hypothetical protein